MTRIADRVRRLLDQHRIDYETIHHETDYTAQDTAEHTRTPGSEFAKAVIVRSGEQYAMAVLPAHHVIDLECLAEALGQREFALAGEDEVAKLCPDCEVGAVPPFGNLYDLPVYVSPSLAEHARITLVAGGHSDVIRMAYDDFEALVKPRSVDFSVLKPT